MNPWAGIARNEKGVALPLALFVLVSLSAFVLAFLSMGGMEPQVARNLSDTARARYVADAAIEWAFDQLANPATNWSTVLGTNKVASSNPQAAWMTGANGATMTLPGLAATSGTFTVTVRNDTLAADTAITGVAADTGGATTDLNNVLIVTATGTYGGVSRQIQVVLRRIILPPMPGALNCGGLQCDFDLGVVSAWTNHHFHVVGLDYAQDPGNPANMVGVSGNMKYAIGTPAGNQSGTGQTFESRVENAMNSHQMNETDGQDQTQPAGTAVKSRTCASPSPPNPPCTVGKNSIAGDAQLVSQVDGSGNFLSNSTSNFVNLIKAQPSVNVLQPSQGCSCNLIIQDGKPIGSNSSLPVNLGTVQSPTITYVKGDPNNNSNAARTVVLKGTNSGAGILIVEDGVLQINDNFRWDGVIILTGKNVAITFDKFVKADVYGGVMLNEKMNGLDTPNYELQLAKNCTHSEDSSGCSGNDSYYTKLYSSQQRRDQAQNIRSLVTMSSWREM